MTMSHFTIASPFETDVQRPALQWAHDIRNVLSTISLHMNTLELLSGHHGVRTADAIHALIGRVTTMCNEALTATDGASVSRREWVNVVQAVEHVAELVLATAPKSFRVDISAARSALAMVNPGDLFRILFNLFHNAVAVAHKTRALNEIGVRVEVKGSIVSIVVADNGPGLPGPVRRRMFQPLARAGRASGGFGLSIARELAESNGGSLRLATSAGGAAFQLELPAFSTALHGDGGFETPAGRLVPTH
jgi:C4-dicarboxylate-specific signal transduction histidine kinase